MLKNVQQAFRRNGMAQQHLLLLSSYKRPVGKRSADRMGAEELLKKAILLAEKDVCYRSVIRKIAFFILWSWTYLGHYAEGSRVTESGMLPQETLNDLNVMLNTINHLSDEIKINSSKNAKSWLDFVTSVLYEG